MKIGCLVKFLIVSTILLIAIFYIFINKFDDFILRPGIRYAIDWSMEGVDDSLKTLPDSKEKKEILQAFEKFTFEQIKSKDIHLEVMTGVRDSLRNIMSDGFISPVEVVDFEEYLKKVVENERRTQDGN